MTFFDKYHTVVIWYLGLIWYFHMQTFGTKIPVLQLNHCTFWIKIAKNDGLTKLSAEL